MVVLGLSVLMNFESDFVQVMKWNLHVKTVNVSFLLQRISSWHCVGKAAFHCNQYMDPTLWKRFQTDTQWSKSKDMAKPDADMDGVEEDGPCSAAMTMGFD